MRFAISIPQHVSDGTTFRIAKRVYIAVDNDAGSARQRIGAALDEQYGYFGIKGLGPVAVSGTPEECVQGLREVADAGAEMILLNPLFDDLKQMDRLAAEVMPHL